MQKQEKGNDPRGKTFAGSESCKKCHSSVYDSYVATTHYNASEPSSEDNINGSFASGQNVFYYGPYEQVLMQSSDSGLYQVRYVNGKKKEAHRFDITFGVKNGQTFLYWKGNKTFQLPISHYSITKSWGTSPGFSTQHANFNRPVGKECFECHSSFINDGNISNDKTFDETLDKNSLLFGIDCERCHGPALDHVNFQQANPNIKRAKYIVTLHSLSIQQKLDMCAICHSGSTRTKIESTFNFKLGDTLANFFSKFQPRVPLQNAKFDVHGNQLQLLASSECFIKSKKLTCTTCHNPHTNASDNLSDYSAKCISCHQNTTHTFDTNTNNNNSINNNCIDCHMPKQPSMAVTFQINGKTEKMAQMLRTHRIAIYDDKEQKISAIVNFLKRKGSRKGIL